MKAFWDHGGVNDGFRIDALENCEMYSLQEARTFFYSKIDEVFNVWIE